MKALYDGIADPYEEAKLEYLRQHADPGMPFIVRNISRRPISSLADIGCGAGLEAAYYESLGIPTVWGIDDSEQMLKKARQRVRHADHFLFGHFDQIPLGDEYVDAVTCLYSFHYVRNMDRAYREMARVLRRGGRLLMVNRHPSSDALEQDRFEDNGQIFVRPLIWGKVPIPCPLHTMEEYLSDTFLQLFEWTEYVVLQFRGATTVPQFFGLVATRR
jgi:ubiquinone/menaquinone biosynthesis C-methylase UbiE